MSERNLLISNWLGLKQNYTHPTEQLQPIINDASQRKYYRCYIEKRAYIVMDSHNDQSFPKFIDIAKQFLAWGLLVPEIYKVDYDQGLILMSDLGNDLYLHKLNDKTADQLYSAALQALRVMQKNKAPSAWALSAMDLSYIKNRLEVFQQWFLKQHLKLPVSIETQQLLANLERVFLKAFTEQPQVLVHLDYHSRNLLVLPGSKPGILDFQDAMIGPITYDLVSLLQDAYISWPREQVEAWLLEYQELAFNAGLISTREHQQFTRFFDLVGLHRHLKNLGVFTRLHHRDGKSKYLHDIPMLLNYILDTCRRYHELQELLEFFEEYVIPQEEKFLCKQ